MIPHATTDQKTPEPRSHYLGVARYVGLVVGGVLGIAVPLALRAGWLPAGIPGQWEWGVLDHPLDLATLGPVLLAVPFVVVLLSAGYWMERRGGVWHVAAGIVGLVGSIATSLLLQATPPAPFNLGKWPNILYWPMSSGYHAVARDELAPEGLRRFLSRYPDFQRDQPDPFHLATHPPGLVLLHYAALRLCAESPELARWIVRNEPDQVRSGYQLLRPLPPLAERAALDLVAFISAACACAAWLPLWRLAARFLKPGRAWLFACTWWFCPGVLVFTPKSDVLYPLFVLLLLWAGTAGVRAAVEGNGLRALCIATTFGVLLWTGMAFSLVYAPFAVGIAVAWGALAWRRPHTRTVVIGAASVVAVTVLALTAALYLATGLNLLESWVVAYQRHAEFNVRFPRSYLGWLVVNPMELVLSAGAPLGTAGLVSIPWLLRGGWDERRPARLVLTAALAVWVILWLSGKNRGEVARLWLAFAPVLLLAAAEGLRLTGRQWSLVLAAHAVSALLTVNTIQGFLDPASVQTQDPRYSLHGSSTCDRTNLTQRANRRGQKSVPLRKSRTVAMRAHDVFEPAGRKVEQHPARDRQHQTSHEAQALPSVPDMPGGYPSPGASVPPVNSSSAASWPVSTWASYPPRWTK